MSANVDQTYATLALLRAANFIETDRGKTVHCLENNTLYWITASGSGANVMTAYPSRFGTLTFALDEFREVDANGDVSNIAANGGKLASDTTPILRGDAAESWEIAWASSNNDIISASKALPDDFDGSLDCFIDVVGASAGTTNAFDLVAGTSWDGGALVADNIDGAAAVADQNVSATIAAADIPDDPERVTLQLTPSAHTTDVMILMSVRLRYYRQNSQ